MKKLHITFTLLYILSLTAAIAQTNGTGIAGDGYYRIRNLASQRYLYVTDDKDYYDKNRDVEDFQAIQLWLDHVEIEGEGYRSPISDPASIIYIKKVGSQYDLTAQGTGVHALTGYYVNVKTLSNGTYEVSASVSKGGLEVVKTLSDNETASAPRPGKGKMGTSGTLNYRRWIVDKITTDHATNYAGISPTIQARGKYYQPFYASFPFKPASEGMKVYYISLVDDNKAVLKEIEGEVPTATPVIIECSSPDPSQNRIDLLPPSATNTSGNLLAGTYFCNGSRPAASTNAYKVFDAATMRILAANDEGKLTLTDAPTSGTSQFEKRDQSTGYRPVTYVCVPANHSYLKCDGNTAKTLIVMTEEEYKGTGIEDLMADSKARSIEGVYSISGRQLRKSNNMAGLPAGMYIVGGHKVLIP